MSFYCPLRSSGVCGAEVPHVRGEHVDRHVLHSGVVHPAMACILHRWLEVAEHRDVGAVASGAGDASARAWERPLARVSGQGRQGPHHHEELRED